MSLQTEIALELLSDLAEAVRGVMKTVVPDMPVEVTVVSGPTPGINIRVKAATTVYPNFIPAKAVMRPTAHYRRLLGLPEREAN